MKIYAIYKGDEFLFVGTAKECAKHFNIRNETVYFWNTQCYKKRISTLKRNGKERNCIRSIVVEEEEDDK